MDGLGSEPILVGYPYLAASRADFLRRLGRRGEARPAYEEAVLTCDYEVERDYLARRLLELSECVG